MSLVDKATLVSKLTTIVNTVYENGSYVVDDLLSTALSMSLLSEINIITVDSIDFLPNLKYYNSPNAMIYYVNNIDVFAVSSNLKWLTLDGRLLRQDSLYGKIWAWGGNSIGFLGDNTTTDKSSPIIVANGFTDWCQLSVGDNHNLGIRTNGTAWAWGGGACGRLGDNTVVNKSSPVSVVGGFTDWCQVSAGLCHSLGVRQNGTAWGWGLNASGQLGDNTVITRSSPVSVVGGFTDWCQASAHDRQSVAVRTNGTVWTWGVNFYGRLGDNTTTSKSSPVSVVGDFMDWCQVSTGLGFMLAVRQNGTAWAWGGNASGQLGDNTTVSKSSPVSVVGGFTDWCQVSAGTNHGLAVRQDGTAWSWGLNVCGQLGIDATTNRSSPVSVAGGFTDWCQVSAGHSHSLAIRQNGTAWAWGLNTEGQLGNNSTTTISSPVSVIGGFTAWCKVSSGRCHSLGVISLC